MSKEIKFVLFAVFVVFCLCVTGNIFAQGYSHGIVIERTGRHANATIVFQGVTGDMAMSDCVRNHLRYCGWFDLKQSGASDYVVRGTANGNSVQLELFNGGNLKIGTFSGTGSTKKIAAGKAVDQILKHEFNIPGICCTKIAFSATVGNGMKEIFVCDYDGQNITRITKRGRMCVEPCWTPNGATLVYCLYDSIAATNLVEYSFALNQSRRLTRYTKGLTSACAVSPNGKMIAFVTDADPQANKGARKRQQQDLYIRNLESGTPIRLTNDIAVESTPAWTPDGRQICFVSNKNGQPQIYLINAAAGAQPVRLRLTGVERHTPAISSSWKLVYSAKVGGYVLALADLTNPTAPKEEKIGDYTVKGSFPGENPSWAPDGRHVVAEDKGVLYIVDTWLGKKRIVIQGKSKSEDPAWSPIL